MRTIVLGIALTGCAASDRTAQRPAVFEAAPPAFGEGECDAARARGMIGRIATPLTVEAARTLSRSRTARAITPGTAVTMDYRSDRLNLVLGAYRKIMRVRCG